VRNNPLKYVDPSGHCYGEFAGTEGCPSDDSEDLGPPATAETIHTALDVLGITPGIGEAADAVNAVAYAIEGDWGNAAISAVGMVPLFGDAAKAGRIGSKVAGKLENAIDGIKGVTKRETTFSRYLSKNELEAIEKTDLLRGGREGPTYFTKDKYKTIERAQNKLSLEFPPEYRVDFKITNTPNIFGPNKVEPKYTNYKGYPNKGGGTEYWTNDKVKVHVVKKSKLE
jgi:hypothetical protein